jgi:hypothetical protein
MRAHDSDHGFGTDLRPKALGWRNQHLRLRCGRGSRVGSKLRAPRV